MSKFQIGDRVIFANNSENYTIDYTDPLWGSDYECIGTVSDIGDGGDDVAIWVDWDNGLINDYAIDMLELYEIQEIEEIEDIEDIEIPSLLQIIGA